MQLPFIKKNEPQKNFFVSLIIAPYRVGAILYEEINSKLFILSSREEEVDKNANVITAEELLTAADHVISFVEASLPEGGNLDKTIFSVPQDWVVEGKISQEHLAKLKKICEDLGLTPVGYLISVEAIISYLTNQEGAPVSALFVEIASKQVIVYLVRAGKVLEVHSGEVEGNVLETTESLLKKIVKVDVLPSKILLLNYKDGEQIQQEFLSHTWPKDIPFLHLPQVTVLERGIENEATINGVAQQMELQVLADPPKTEMAREEIAEQNVDVIEPFKKDQDEELKAEENNDGESLSEVAPEEFGFMKDKDVADEPVMNPEEDIKVNDVLGSHEVEQKGKDEPEISYYKEEEGSGDQDMDVENKSTFPKLAFLSTLPAIPELLSKLKMPNIKLPAGLPHAPGGKSLHMKLGIAIAALILFIIMSSFVYYNGILKADISVISDTKNITKTADVSFAENPDSSSTIKIDIIEDEEKGDDTKDATGTKETGDKAKGSITIYNKTESSKTFPKGTIVIGPNALEFQLQDDLKIASTSSFSTSLSSANGKIEASEFGKEYNLPSGTNFTVKGFSTSDYIAKNSDATSGGTKKTTKVVSKKDLDDLLVQVTDKLQQQAIENARKKAGSDQSVISEPLEVDVVDHDYTKKTGDEASSVGITATIKYSFGGYKQSDIQQVVDDLVKGEVPASYKMDTQSSKIEVGDVKVGKDKDATGKLNINAVYTPRIENSAVATEIKGKSTNDAVEKIKSIEGVRDVVVNFSRKLPLFPNMLPASVKNINIEVSK